MNKIKLLLKPVIGMMLLLAAFSSSAQYMKQKNDSVLVLLKKAINTKNKDAIRSLLNTEYAKTDVTGFFEKQIFPLGELKETLLIDTNEEFVNYKLVYERSVLQLSMYLDDENKISGLLFKPYQPKNAISMGTSNPMQTDLDKKIDAVIRNYIRKPNTVGLSVGIIYAGKNSIYYYGETGRGNGKLPDAATIFEIGSISKTFTATLLAYFVNEGKIRLTDPVTKYLPDSVAENTVLKEVSVEMLSNHTSGFKSIPDNFETGNYNQLNPYQHYTRKMLFSYLKTCKLNSKPGEVYAYSNMAVGLLGIILEQISGQTYEQLVKTIICKPLKLESTVQHISPKQKDRFVKVYNEDGNETPAWDLDAMQAAGCLRSTVNDLLKYAEANMKVDQSELSKAFQLTHQITFDKNPKVGLNWHFMNINGTEYLWHNGGTGGSRSFLAFNSAKNNAVVVLSNSARSVDAVAADIIKLLH